MHFTAMVFVPEDTDLLSVLAKYSEEATKEDGAETVYSDQDHSVAPCDTLEELKENYKKKTGKELPDDYYFTWNIDAKYDWMQVGGRWSGFLDKLPNASSNAILGARGYLEKEQYTRPEQVDQGLVSDINWRGIIGERQRECEKAVDFFSIAMEDLPLLKTLNELEGNREAYLEQPRLQAFQQLLVEEELLQPLQRMNEMMLNLSKPLLLKALGYSRLSTHAILYNDEWTDSDAACDDDKSTGELIMEIVEEIISEGKGDTTMVFLVDFHN